MSAASSVSLWIDQLKTGDAEAVTKLWQRYFKRLVGLARKKLRDAPRRAADEEDVALSAFDSFCRRAAQGQFPRLADRDDLWHLLIKITSRKAFHLMRREGAQKRGGRGRAGAAPGDNAIAEAVLEEALDRGPTPEYAAQTAEEFRRLLSSMGDGQLRAIALLSMEGYTYEEIAARLGCSVKTVQRRWTLIRKTWEREAGS
jgi:RNA polymerase sigma factor (sigma-70 family)